MVLASGKLVLQKSMTKKLSIFISSNTSALRPSRVVVSLLGASGPGPEDGRVEGGDRGLVPGWVVLGLEQMRRDQVDDLLKVQPEKLFFQTLNSFGDFHILLIKGQSEVSAPSYGKTYLR